MTRSFTPKGTPCSGPRRTPRRIAARSVARAAFNAASASTVTHALSVFFSSIASRTAFTASTGETLRRAIAAARSAAGMKRRSSLAMSPPRRRGCYHVRAEAFARGGFARAEASGGARAKLTADLGLQIVGKTRLQEIGVAGQLALRLR